MEIKASNNNVLPALNEREDSRVVMFFSIFLSDIIKGLRKYLLVPPGGKVGVDFTIGQQYVQQEVVEHLFPQY